MGQGRCTCKHLKVKLAPFMTDTIFNNVSLSPGYMLTKLTRTILEKDNELKVRFSRTHFSKKKKIDDFVGQKTWESLTPMGRVSLSLY